MDQPSANANATPTATELEPLQQGTVQTLTSEDLTIHLLDKEDKERAHQGDEDGLDEADVDGMLDADQSVLSVMPPAGGGGLPPDLGIDGDHDALQLEDVGSIKPGGANVEQPSALAGLTGQNQQSRSIAHRDLNGASDRPIRLDLQGVVQPSLPEGGHDSTNIPPTPPFTPSSPTSPLVSDPPTNTETHRAAPTPPLVPPVRAAPPRYPPSRRPKGWISSLTHPRVVSDLSPKGKMPLALKASSTSTLPPVHGEAAATLDSLEKPSENGSAEPSTHVQPSNVAGAGRSRVTSVHAQPPSGRRVSGTMQYAIAPVPRHLSLAPSELDLEQHTPSPSPSPDLGPDSTEDESRSVIEHEDPDNFETDESFTLEAQSQIRYDVSFAQEQDEVWMAYVRAQLSALFPDFFEANPGALAPGAFTELAGGEGSATLAAACTHGESVDADGREDGGVESRDDGTIEAGSEVNVYHRGSPASRARSRSQSQSQSYRRASLPPSDIFSTPGTTSFMSGASTATTDGSSFATPPPHLGAAAMLRGNVVLPSVREEMSELREEIMRLRDVIGGLAQGMTMTVGVGVGASESQDRFGGEDRSDSESQRQEEVQQRRDAGRAVDGEEEAGVVEETLPGSEEGHEGGADPAGVADNQNLEHLEAAPQQDVSVSEDQKAGALSPLGSEVADEVDMKVDNAEDVGNRTAIVPLDEKGVRAELPTPSPSTSAAVTDVDQIQAVEISEPRRQDWQDLRSAFKETAQLSMEIITALNVRLATQPRSQLENDLGVSDKIPAADVFSRTNLEALLRAVQAGQVAR